MPSALQVQATGSKDARVRWTDTQGEGPLVIRRGTTSSFGASSVIATVQPGTQVYNDHALAASSSYFWWVGGEGPVSLATPAAPVAGPTFVALQDALYDWAVLILGANVAVIWTDQNSDKPEKPFVSLSLFGPEKVPGTDHSQDNGESLGGMRRYRLTIQAYTDPPSPDGAVVDASQYMADLVASLDDEVVVSQLFDSGVGVGEVFSPTDLSQLLNTKIERRVALDIMLNVASNVPALPTYSIDKVLPPQGTFQE